MRLSRLERTTVIAIAFLTFVIGLLNSFPLLALRLNEKGPVLSGLNAYHEQEWSRHVSLLSGFLLIYLSFQLLQRRRIAWMIALAAATVALLSPLVKELDWRLTLAPLVEVLLLVATRRLFVVRSEIHSISRGALITVILLFMVALYGVAGFWWLDRRDFGAEFHLWDAISRTYQEFALDRQSDLVPQTRHARWFLDSLEILGLMTIGVGVYSLFRPLAYRYRTLPRERQQATALVETYGKNPLDYFKLWEDKTYFFSANKACVIAYKVALNTAISLGNPIGQPDALQATTLAFLDECFRNNWNVAFHQVPPNLLPMYQTLNLNSIKIGEEAIVDLDIFSNDTAQRKDFRYIRRRMEKDGYHLVNYAPPHAADLLDQLQVISDDWLTIPGRRERTFTLGQFQRDYLNRTPIYTVEDALGIPIAFTNLIPTYRKGEAAIDLMRHRATIPNGTMDYLFIELMLRLCEQNYNAFSLGMAPLSGIEDSIDSPVIKKATHLLYENLNRYFSYKGLRNYKAKFAPRWEDRFIVYQGTPLNLLQIVAALVKMSE